MRYKLNHYLILTMADHAYKKDGKSYFFTSNTHTKSEDEPRIFRFLEIDPIKKTRRTEVIKRYWFEPAWYDPKTPKEIRELGDRLFNKKT